MKLLEIVIPSQPQDDAVATGFQLAKQLRKVPVRAGNCDGFIGNRVLGVYAAAAMHMVEDGASPYDIDRVMVEFGYPMGPFSMFDLAGGDIGWDTRKRKEPTRPPEERYVHIADRLCENGWFGQKTGEAGISMNQAPDAACPILRYSRSLTQNEPVKALSHVLF